MSLENVELDPNVEVYKPPLEYVTHEEFTMQMERESNRKLKAEIRRKKKAKDKPKEREIIIWTSAEGVRLFEDACSKWIRDNYKIGVDPYHE